MRILSVCERLGDDAYSWRVKNVVEQLTVQGNSIRVIENYSLSRRNWLSKMIHFPKSVVRTSGERYRGSYDLVYGNSQATVYCLPGRLGRVPLVFDMHGLPVEEYLLQGLADGTPSTLKPSYLGYLLTGKLNLAFSDTIVCISKTQMRWLSRSNRIPEEKMVYATNGVDTSYFRPHSTAEVKELRMSLGLDDKIVFGYIGSIDKNSNNWLGVQQIVRTAEAIQDPEVGFLIVGGQESRRSGNLVMVQRQPRDRLKEYYAACDVFVLPLPGHVSMSIASPTKFAEYAAAGRPILSTDVGDPPEFIRKNDCGRVIADFSVSSLMEGIMQMKSESSAKLSSMGARARAMAEQDFDWAKIGEKLSHSLLKYQK